MTRRDFSKDRARRITIERGYEPVSGGSYPGTPQMRKSKADERQAVADLILPSTIITKFITCACGHAGQVEIPASGGHSFVCSECGRKLPGSA